MRISFQKCFIQVVSAKPFLLITSNVVCISLESICFVLYLFFLSSRSCIIQNQFIDQQKNSKTHLRPKFLFTHLESYFYTETPLVNEMLQLIMLIIKMSVKCDRIDRQICELMFLNIISNGIRNLVESSLIDDGQLI